MTESNNSAWCHLYQLMWSTHHHQLCARCQPVQMITGAVCLLSHCLMVVYLQPFWRRLMSFIGPLPRPVDDLNSEHCGYSIYFKIYVYICVPCVCVCVALCFLQCSNPKLNQRVASEHFMLWVYRQPFFLGEHQNIPRKLWDVGLKYQVGDEHENPHLGRWTSPSMTLFTCGILATGTVCPTTIINHHKAYH